MANFSSKKAKKKDMPTAEFTTISDFSYLYKWMKNKQAYTKPYLIIYTI